MEPKRGPGRPRKNSLPLDPSLLTDEDRESLRQKAKAKITEEQRAAAREDFMVEAEREERAKLLPEEEMVDITLDLAEHSDRIVLDGRHFMNGRTYVVSRKVGDTLREIQGRGWDHQAEIDGKDKNTYRKAKNVVLSPHGVINTSRLARV